MGIEQNKQANVMNRLHIMYGPCGKLSDTAVLAYTDRTYRLFRLTGSGAKEVANGEYLALDKENRILTIGNTANGIYTFDGDTIAEQTLIKIVRAPSGGFIVANENGYGVLDAQGKIMLELKHQYARLFSNDIVELVEKLPSEASLPWGTMSRRHYEDYPSKTWLVWALLGRSDCDTVRGNYEAIHFKNCLIFIRPRQ